MKKLLLAPLIASALLSWSSMTSAATCYLFDASIDATVTGPGASAVNAVTQTLLVRDEGFRDHVLEFALYPRNLGLDEFFTGEIPPSDPTAPFDPRAGDIVVMSNTALRGLLFSQPDPTVQENIAAARDLGTFEEDSEGYLVFALDPLAGVETQFNAFWTLAEEGDPAAPPVGLAGVGGSDGGTGLFLVAGHGALRLMVQPDGGLEGDIDIVGAVLPATDPPLVAQYQGNFTGSFLRTASC